MFARLESVFFEEIRRESKGFKLYKTMVNFLRLISQSKFTEKEIQDIETLSRKMVSLCFEIENDGLSNEEIRLKGFEVFPKLHHLIHYGQQIKIFGPPKRNSMMPVERKHQEFKSKSRSIYNYINPAFTFAKMAHLQMIRRIEEFQESSIVELGDFFDCTLVEFMSTLPPDAKSLSKKNSPHDMRKEFPILLRVKPRRFVSRNEMWLQPKKYYQSASDGSIMAMGDLYVTDRNSQWPENHRQVETIMKKLKLKPGGEIIVTINFLNHLKNFIFRKGSETYLIEGF